MKERKEKETTEKDEKNIKSRSINTKDPSKEVIKHKHKHINT